MTAVSDRLTFWDIGAIAVYFGLVLTIGFLSLFRKNRGTISGYFLAGRFMTWLPVGASLFASNIGSEHFIGLAGSGAASGIGVGAFELNALIILQLLGWVFLPVYIASGVHTLPEYMSKRFGRTRIRVYLAVLSLLLYIFTKISVNMYSGALFVQEALGWNIYVAMLLVLGMTAICTITGGLAAVIYTDTLQCFLMIFGGIGLAIYSFMQVGGYTGLMSKYMRALPNHTLLHANSTCGLPSQKSFTMLRPPSDPDFPWPGFLLGQSPASIWYWAADQMMVQRALAAKSLSQAQGATLFAGYLKILPLFIIVMPGMISRVLYPDDIGCVTDCLERCGNAISCSNVAYPKLVIRLMPHGARGIMLAVMLAALMSDLTSIFNSSSTLFTMDIWHRLRKRASAREMLLVGRLWILVMVVVSLLWVPIVYRLQGGQLYIYIQAIAADLAPPIAAVYLLAVLWPRTNEMIVMGRLWILVLMVVSLLWVPIVYRLQGGQLYIYVQAVAADLAPPITAVYLLAVLWPRTSEMGAFWGLMTGFVIGTIRMVLEFVYVAPGCGHPDTRPPIVADLHYMYFAMALFWFTIVVTVVISLLTPPPEHFRLIRTTFWTRKDKGVRPDDEMLEMDVETDKTDPSDYLTDNGDGDLVKLEAISENGQSTMVDHQGRQGGAKNEIDETEGSSCKQRFWKGYNWFCGFDTESNPAAPSKLAEFEKHLRKITSLTQTRTQKRVLNANLALILCVAVFLYVYFSVISPIQAQKYM